jgi:hypothetical protein
LAIMRARLGLPRQEKEIFSQKVKGSTVEWVCRVGSAECGVRSVVPTKTRQRYNGRVIWDPLYYKG